MKNRIYLVPLIIVTMVTTHVTSILAQDYTIVAFGDSITAKRTGVIVYADVLKKAFAEKNLKNIKVINSGVPGNTSSMAKERFEKDVLAYKPNLVIIQLGTNDSAVDVWKDPPETTNRVPIDVYEQNLRGFFAALRAQNAKIILVTPTPTRWTDKLKGMYGKPPYKADDPDGFTVPLKPYVERAKQVARSEKVILIDLYSAFTKYHKVKGQTMDDLFLDGLHPNTKGQQIEADLLLEQIRKLKIGY